MGEEAAAARGSSRAARGDEAHAEPREGSAARRGKLTAPVIRRKMDILSAFKKKL